MIDNINDFNKKLTESMRYENKQCIILPEHDELLLLLHGLKNMMIGRSEIMFCNGFINEAIQLLINSIFLYEDGNFDCAFYSIRQASEVTNNMLYLSNVGKTELHKWNKKGYFPLNAKLLEKLEKIDINYTEVKTALSDFFKKHDELIKAAHKTIHKQGFDTFYTFRTMNQYSDKFIKKSETDLFVELLKNSIGKIIVIFIVVEPLSLILADDDLSARFNFDPITEALDIEFFKKYFSEDIIKKIKNTSFFKEFSTYFASQEKMTTATFDVVRNKFFNIDSLDEIENQKHLLNSYEKVILEILQKRIKLSFIYPDCSMFNYFTSIRNNYHTSEWHSDEYQKYLNKDETFNQPYYNVFRSIVRIFDANWILEHNEFLLSNEIDNIKVIAKKYRQAYESLFVKDKL